MDDHQVGLNILLNILARFVDAAGGRIEVPVTEYSIFTSAMKGAKLHFEEPDDPLTIDSRYVVWLDKTPCT